MTETGLVTQLVSIVRPHNSDISLALVATLLVIYGDVIIRRVRRLVRKQSVFIRVPVFVGLCTFGFGSLTVWFTPVLGDLLLQLRGLHYLIAVTAGFVLLGVLAERFHRS